jgi:hypothetical protein
MAESVMWIIPEAPAPARSAEGDKVTRVASGRGLRFGVLDNSKSNADELLGMIIDGVKARYPDAVIVRTRKPSAAIGATADVLAQLEKETDVVIAAMAD